MRVISHRLRKLALVLCGLPIMIGTQIVGAQDLSDTRPLVLTHVTVIDATGAPEKPNMTVVIIGDRIAKIERSTKYRVPKNAEVMDATHKFLVPGLWDMHAHLLSRWEYAPVYVANGVTGIRDMGTGLPLGEIATLRKSVESGVELGPRFAYAGPILDGRDANPGMTLLVSSPDEARRDVDKLVDAGVDFIKVYDSLSRDSFLAIADEAKKRGVPFAGHLPYAVTANEASDKGQKSIEHVFVFWDACSTAGDQFRDVRLEFQAARQKGTVPLELQQKFATSFHSMITGYDSEKCEELGRRFAKNGTWQVPTFAEQLPFLLKQPSEPQDGRLSYVPEKVAARWRTRLANLSEAQKAAAQQQADLRINIIRDLHRAGVRILAGTDADVDPDGFIYDVPGFSLHDELELLVRAGLSPMEALQSATSSAAQFLDLADLLGTIEKGKKADLLLLDADPLLDIRNTRTINSVIVKGKVLDRHALDDLLFKAAAKFHTN